MKSPVRKLDLFGSSLTCCLIKDIVKITTVLLEAAVLKVVGDIW